MKSIMVGVLVFLSIAATGFKQQNEPVPGKQIFESKCAWCHGKEGTKGLFGAKNLQKSKLSEIEYFNIILNGKNRMPTWKYKLTTEQISGVIDYLQELRK